MVKFIHLSDLHIHGSMDKADNQNAVKVVEYILERYAKAPKPERPVILLTGDIVDDGKKDQYEQAVAILKPLVDAGFRVLASPGNHDCGRFGINYETRARDRFRKYILGKLLGYKGALKPGMTLNKLYPLRDQEQDVVFIGLDSVVGNEKEVLQLASGEVGATQRTALLKMLRAMKEGEKAIVYFHHHPFYRHELKRIALELDDAKEVMAILSGRANFVCFGHKHVSDCWPGQKQIDWILASGKSTERNEQYKFEFREVTIAGQDNEVSKVVFRRD